MSYHMMKHEAVGDLFSVSSASRGLNWSLLKILPDHAAHIAVAA